MQDRWRNEVEVEVRVRVRVRVDEIKIWKWWNRMMDQIKKLKRHTQSPTNADGSTVCRWDKKFNEFFLCQDGGDWYRCLYEKKRNGTRQKRHPNTVYCKVNKSEKEMKWNELAILSFVSMHRGYSMKWKCKFKKKRKQFTVKVTRGYYCFCIKANHSYSSTVVQLTLATVLYLLVLCLFREKKDIKS
jgi:hypothetical protein